MLCIGEQKTIKLIRVIIISREILSGLFFPFLLCVFSKIHDIASVRRQKVKYFYLKYNHGPKAKHLNPWELKLRY